MRQRNRTKATASAYRRRAVLARALGVLALVLGVAAVDFALAEGTAAYLIVVHVTNPEPSVSREFLADAFLKKTTRWQSGDPLRPVDQRPDAKVRALFTESVLRRSVSAVRSYWQQRIFSGRGVPPPEVDSDTAVLRYIQQNPGAVGYVSGQADTSEVKVVNVR
jgi:ABC-type phosphate transport system substrate-binding protein